MTTTKESKATGLAAQLLAECEEYCRRTETAEYAFGDAAYGNKRLLPLLRDGRTVTLETHDKIKRVMELYPNGFKGQNKVDEIRALLKREKQT